MKLWVVSALLLLTLALAACGGDDDTGDFQLAVGSTGAPAMGAFPAAAPAIEDGFFGETRTFSTQANAAASPPFAAPAPQAATSQAGGSALDDGSLDAQQQTTDPGQERIIIRTVDMGLTVATDVPDAVDRIGLIAQGLGGWVISSNRSERHRGSIAVRVPAERLEEAVQALRELAVEVTSEVSTSRDVTDEYVDTSARLTSLHATEAALLKLFEQAVKVEDALAVQEALTRVQGDIERLEGRIKLLEQTSAFSLISVRLQLEPQEMAMDAGADQAVSVGNSTRFRAPFQPPEGIEEFRFTWDFGDGSAPVTGTRTAPTLEPDTRITATVTHVYGDERDSPFIAEISMTGTGEAGVVEAEDTVIVTVTRLPTIEVFAGEDRVLEEDQETEFTGSFTRPQGVTELTFTWDFGDGSAPVTGSVSEGATTVSVSHAYPDHRPFAFTATLKINAESAAGKVEAQNSLRVLVTEGKGWVIGGWSAGDQLRSAVRALSGVGQFLVTALIWLAILSPIWGVGGFVALRAGRRAGSWRRGRRSTD